MVQDLSYINEQPLEAVEEAIKRAVEKSCLETIVNYLGDVATTMDSKGIEALNSDTLRAMAAQFTQRLEELTNGEN
jgi:hypothetical protein